ncbi:glycogen debranching protein GlgX [Alteraurantiacibacter palmitatis]|uniref:Glycogen debranching protein GlgX n=1 Tax=Alteraurantiacibacter palmitatis TaxID=2054628 RepID=A0ABV7E8S5_9SPHN
MNITPGVTVTPDGTTFAVRAPQARAVALVLDDAPIVMERAGDLWVAQLPRDCTGAQYGYRADGEWAPERGLWFDPAKLLVDPYAVELDRRFRQHPSLGQYGADTAPIVPRARVTGPLPEVPQMAPVFQRGGLIYEVNVRGFTMQHPDVPKAMRGTVAALAHPAVIAHLRMLHVSAVELMPIVAWIDERHLPPLGLSNAWGYNPVAMMALDPGLCPGGVAELRGAVAALHEAGIGVILDIVLNHSGESDRHGGVLSLRGLDDSHYAKEPDGQLCNVTGCGNTLDFGQPHMRALALATLRHFVRHAGVDGFRFDLAPVLARGSNEAPDFDPAAPIFAEIAADPLLADRVLIAEPWDIGPGGYALGRFPDNWLEWNDRFRDDVRRFWRGDATIGTLATRLAGSSDVFGTGPSRSVNFLAAHDGFTLADCVTYAHRHNLANGEENRDGHGGEVSWNHGVEGPGDDPRIKAARKADVEAMLGTLFASTGTLLLTAGDEFGRTQGGNNNAYAQDNPTSWLDWENRDRELEAHVARLAAWRAGRLEVFQRFPVDGHWRGAGGAELTAQEWQSGESHALSFRLGSVRVSIDRKAREVRVQG